MRPGRLGLVLDVGEQQLEEIVDAALVHLEPPLHIALAEGQLRVEHEMALQRLSMIRTTTGEPLPSP